MPAKRPIIVGLGEVLWDLLPTGRQLGGAPANFAYHAQALGADAWLVSAVGRDELGREALARLRAAGLDVRHVAEDATHPTGTVGVELNAAGQPRFTIHEHVAWDHLELSEATLALAPRADAVCFGSLGQRGVVARNAIRRFLAATRPDCLRVFDVNLRAPHFTREVVLDSLAVAAVFKLNEDELPVVAGWLGVPADETAIFARLWQAFPRQIVALTRGERGATLATRSERVDLPAIPPPVLADTVGAGDAFTAALVCGWLARRPLRVIGERAVRLASFVCSRPGAMPDLKDFVAAVGA